MDTDNDSGKTTLSTGSKIVIVAIVVVVLIAVVYFAGQGSNNQTNTSGTGGNGYYMQHGNFSMAFTTQPTFSTITQELEKNYNVTAYNYNDTESNYVLSADYVSSAFSNSTLTPEENLKNELSYTGNQNGGEITSSSPTTYEGLPAIEYTLCYNTKQICFTGRDILKGDDLYETGYSYDVGNENQQIESAFFDSLTFGNPANATAPQSSPTLPPQQNTQSTNQPSQNTSPSVPANLTPSLINQIEPSVVEVNCYAADESVESSGSGISARFSGTDYVETNYHVVGDAVVNGQSPDCYAVFPEAPDFLYNGNYGDYHLALSVWHYNPNIYQDVAMLTLGAPVPNTVALNQIPLINNFYNSMRDEMSAANATTSFCSPSEVAVGDAVTVFGYPKSGNLLGISETITSGVISGILPGPIYKTDAPIDHGNSGGIAILDKNLCSLGIPTLGESGLTAGIGYIQSYILANDTTP